MFFVFLQAFVKKKKMLRRLEAQDKKVEGNDTICSPFRIIV